MDWSKLLVSSHHLLVNHVKWVLETPRADEYLQNQPLQGQYVACTGVLMPLLSGMGPGGLLPWGPSHKSLARTVSCLNHSAHWVQASIPLANATVQLCFRSTASETQSGHQFGGGIIHLGQGAMLWPPMRLQGHDTNMAGGHFGTMATWDICRHPDLQPETKRLGDCAGGQCKRLSATGPLHQPGITGTTDQECSSS